MRLLLLASLLLTGSVRADSLESLRFAPVRSPGEGAVRAAVAFGYTGRLGGAGAQGAGSGSGQSGSTGEVFAAYGFTDAVSLSVLQQLRVDLARTPTPTTLVPELRWMLPVTLVGFRPSAAAGLRARFEGRRGTTATIGCGVDRPIGTSLSFLSDVAIEAAIAGGWGSRYQLALGWRAAPGWVVAVEGWGNAESAGDGSRLVSHNVALSTRVVRGRVWFGASAGAGWRDRVSASFAVASGMLQVGAQL